MKRSAPLLLTAAIAATPALAQGDIFLCVDDSGRKTYQNTGAVKGCKRVDVQPITSVPAPRVPVAASAGNGIRPAMEQRSASFPRVEAETQRARDNDRRRILEDELRGEEDGIHVGKNHARLCVEPLPEFRQPAQVGAAVSRPIKHRAFDAYGS